MPSEGENEEKGDYFGIDEFQEQVPNLPPPNPRPSPPPREQQRRQIAATGANVVFDSDMEGGEYSPPEHLRQKFRDAFQRQSGMAYDSKARAREGRRPARQPQVEEYHGRVNENSPWRGQTEPYQSSNRRNTTRNRYDGQQPDIYGDSSYIEEQYFEPERRPRSNRPRSYETRQDESSFIEQQYFNQNARPHQTNSGHFRTPQRREQVEEPGFIEDQYFSPNPNERPYQQRGTRYPSHRNQQRTFHEDDSGFIEEQYFEPRQSAVGHFRPPERSRGPRSTQGAPRQMRRQHSDRYEQFQERDSNFVQNDYHRADRHQQPRSQRPQFDQRSASARQDDLAPIEEYLASSPPPRVSGRYDLQAALESVQQQPHNWYTEDSEAGRAEDMSDEMIERHMIEEEQLVEHIQQPSSAGLSKDQFETGRLYEHSEPQLPINAMDLANRIRMERKKADVAPVMEKDLDGSLMNLYRLWSHIPPIAKMGDPELVQLLAGRILYNDNGLLVLNKPYGIDSIAAGSRGPDVNIHRLLPQLKEIVVPDADTLTEVHRLDRNATGVMIFATNKDVLRHVHELFRARMIVKTYWSLTKGVPDPIEAVIDIPLILARNGPSEKVVPRPKRTAENMEYVGHTEWGHDSVTEYSVLRSVPQCALVECTAKTGFKHQIRSHLGFGVSCPILGDHKYSDYGRLAPQRLPSEILTKLGIRSEKSRHMPMFLHARQMVLPEFVNGQNLVIQAPLPQFFRFAMRKLKILMPK